MKRTGMQDTIRQIDAISTAGLPRDTVPGRSASTLAAPVTAPPVRSRNDSAPARRPGLFENGMDTPGWQPARRTSPHSSVNGPMTNCSSFTQLVNCW